MERALTFRSRGGRTLFGIFHEPAPAAVRRGTAVVLLNPGIKYRVAPNRLNVKMARLLCGQGFPVLRFDPEGIGDSEGELPEGAPVGDVWGAIQRGLFVRDVLAANDCLAGLCPGARLALAGNCGGAITALIAAAGDARVRGLCLVDVPVYLWSAQRTFADTATRGGERLDYLFWEYLKRAARPRAWLRFLTFKSDYAALVRVALAKARGAQSRSGARADLDLVRFTAENNLNPEFFRSYERCRDRGVVIHFVAAGNDPGLETFRTFFLERYLAGRRPEDRSFATTVVEGANHVYSLEDSQRALFAVVGAWTAALEAGRGAG